METLSLTNFKNLLAYPFKDKKSGTKIFIGSLLLFSTAIIPILPTMIVLGYIMHIAKRIIDGDGQLSLPDWNQWGEYLKEGFKGFVVLLIYSIPLILVFSFGYFVYFLSFLGLAALEGSVNHSFWSLVLPFSGMGVLFLSLSISIILAMLEILFLPVGLMHVVHTGKVSSIFSPGQWWPLLKRNFLGFQVAIIFLFGFYYVLALVTTALYLTVVLCFLLPFVLMPMTFLIGLWTIPLFAQAYREVKPEPLEVLVIEG